MNPYDASDGSTKTPDGQYTNVEIYLNELAAPVVNRQYLDASTAVKVVNATSYVRVFPNPYHSGNLNVIATEKVSKVEIFTLSGVKITERKFNGTNVSFPMLTINPAVYLVKVEMGNGMVHPTLLIVK